MNEFDKLYESKMDEAVPNLDRTLKYELPARKAVLKDIAELSSGTLGTLSGFNSYDDLDKLQGAFFDHAVNSGISYKDWNDAWRYFLDDFKVKYDNKGVAKDSAKLKKALF